MTAISTALVGRLVAIWQLKLAAMAGVNGVFWMGYGFLARHAVFPEGRVPVTAIDRAVDYAPGFWVWVYLSQFLLTGIVPWLIDSVEELKRYLRAIGWLAGLSFAVYVFYPVASPRAVEGTAEGMMAWVARMDGRYNAMPSLHAGFLALVGCLGWRLFAPGRPPMVVRVGFVVWAAAILYSTLATRQHYAWDLVAGLVVGALAEWMGRWRSGAARSKAAEDCRTPKRFASDGRYPNHRRSL